MGKTLEKSKLKSYADFYAEIPIVEDNYEVCDRTDNPKKPKLKCKLCNHKPLIGTWNMRNHLAKFHKIVISKNSKRYICYVCDMKFKDYPDLSDHTDEVHKVDNKYKCDKCDTACETKMIGIITYSLHITFLKGIVKISFLVTNVTRSSIQITSCRIIRVKFIKVKLLVTYVEKYAVRGIS